MDRIDKRAEFTLVRYANCWEDAGILCEALKPAPGKRILSIASAGDNTLSLLASGAELVAVDLNPSQLACLELRLAAIRKLDRDACLAFLGIKESKERKNVYSRLRNELSPKARAFWDANHALIENGIIHCGKFERYFQLFKNWVIPLIHSRKTVAALLTEKERWQRITFYEKTWNKLRWRLLFKIFFSRTVMGRMGRDPEFFRYVDTPVSSRILARTKYALTELSTHDNPYLAYILNGNFNGAVPDYLQQAAYEKLRNPELSLSLVEGSIEDALKNFGTDSFDAYNLSDIFEYLDIPACKNLYSLLLSKARPGARFAYWNMLAPRRCSEFFPGQVKYLEELSEELFSKDRAFFYSRFVVEERAQC